MSTMDDLRHLLGVQLAPGALDGEPTKKPRAERQDRRRNGDARALTIRSAARKLGIARPTLQRLIDDERIRVVPWIGRTAGTVPVGGRVRIPASEVERIAEQGIPTLPEPSRKAKGAQPKPRAPGKRIRDLPY
jgi:excisionase family DNA binding protein